MKTTVTEIVFKKSHPHLSETALKQCVSPVTSRIGGQVEFSPEELMRRSFAAIDSSHLIVVDLTDKRVGLGIEAGYANAKKTPIVVIAKEGSDISTTLQGISQKLFFYKKFEDLVHFCELLMIPHVQP